MDVDITDVMTFDTPSPQLGVSKELQNMNPNKSTGLDSIGPRFLCDGATALHKTVTHLINLSITKKTVPACTKLAKVTPLFKKGSKLEVGNYRPVSVLTAVSKILEKAVYVQVDTYCKEKGIIYPLQSGFRRNYSAGTCLIQIPDCIRSEISNGNFVGMMLLDVQKAFDSVNHEMLCAKIHLAGIDDTWFRSYLEERKQVVNVNNCMSSEMSIVCGVPQGSLLGPWCYLLYSNDIASCVSCNLVLYADDTILLVSHKNVNEVSQRLSEAASKCFHWLTNNCLSMHMGKTEVIIFSSKRKQCQTRNFVVTLENHAIEPKHEVKYLGLKLNNTLSGEPVVKDIQSKCTNRLKFLYRHRDSLNSKIRKTLALALTQSYFDYAVSAWYMGLSRANKKKIQVSQNKVIRFILNLGPRL
jgi:hypothetical protein